MPPNISRYLNVHSAYFPSFRSDGRRLAFLSNITGVPQVWSVSFDPALRAEPQWPDPLTFHQERVLGIWHSPAAGDDRLIFAMDSGGNEIAQLTLLSPAGGREECLTADRPDAIHSFLAWHPAGRQIAFASNRRHPALFDLYLQDLESGQIRLLWQNDRPGFFYYGSFSPDGRHLLFSLVYTNTSYDLCQVDLANGQLSKLSSQPGCYDFPAYTPDGRQVYVISNAGRDLRGIARIDLATGNLAYIHTPGREVEALLVTPDGRRLIFALNEDGAQRLAILNLADGSLQDGPKLPPGMSGLYGDAPTLSPDGCLLAFSFTHSAGSFDVMVWDLRTGRLHAVTRSAHGGLAVEDFVAPERIVFASFDGLEIPAWFYRPHQQNGPAPVVVWVHGGPEGQYRPYFNPVVQYLLACGYAVLAPNVRGSSGYGRAYMDLDNGRQRMDSVADLAHAAYWLRDQPGIDGRRIAVMGGSYGGFMVLAGLTHYPELWAAGVDIVGISNFVTFLENTSSYRRSHREAEYGSLEHDREFLESISPANHLARIQAPLLVIHGANDPRVPLSEAEQVVENLRSRGVPVEYLVFADEGHGLVKLANKQVAYSAVAAFLEKHLTRGLF